MYRKHLFDLFLLAPDMGGGTAGGTTPTGGATPTGAEANGAQQNAAQAATLEAITAREDVIKWANSMADQRVSKALETARAKWEQEATQQQDEAKKLEKMTAAEREKYEFQKERDAFEQQKAEFEHKSLAMEAAKQMIDAGLPDLSAYITGKDAAETAQNIAAVTKVLGAWKQTAITAAMGGTTPKDTTQTHTKYTRADIEKMTTEEINKAWKSGLIDLTR